MKNSKDEFIELIYEINKYRGLDDLTSKIIGILYAEPREVSLKELAKRTGYSISAVSTVMKMLSKSIIVKRFKKPKSRKIYFYMEKDVLPYLSDFIKKNVDIIGIAKKRVPKIIDRYKKSKVSGKEMKIIKNYYRQILVIDKIMRKLLESVKKNK